MSSRKPRTILEMYMVMLKTASERSLTAGRIASYNGLEHRACESYLLSMESHGLVTSHHEGKRRYWDTTSKGRQLAIDIGDIFKQAGIELRK